MRKHSFLALAGVLCGCSSTSTPTAYTPYTGVDIPTAEIVAGVGCGEGGIDHYAAIVSPSSDAGSLADLFAADAGMVLGSVFACYVPNGVFESLDAATYDVWIYAYSAGLPPNLPCANATCPLQPADIATLVNDQSVPGLQALRSMKCVVTALTGAHPLANACRVLRPPALPDGSTADAAASGDAADAGAGDTGDATDVTAQADADAGDADDASLE